MKKKWQKETEIKTRVIDVDRNLLMPIVMIGLLATGWVLGFGYGKYTTETKTVIVTKNVTRYVTLNCTPRIVYECIYECYSKPEWLETIENFHVNKTYEIHGYNCVDFSRDLVRELRDMGYDAYQTQGKCGNKTDPPNELHSWVKICLDYEPQTGECISGFCTENK